MKIYQYYDDHEVNEYDSQKAKGIHSEIPLQCGSDYHKANEDEEREECVQDQILEAGLSEQCACGHNHQFLCDYHEEVVRWISIANFWNRVEDADQYKGEKHDQGCVFGYVVSKIGAYKVPLIDGQQNAHYDHHICLLDKAGKGVH